MGTDGGVALVENSPACAGGAHGDDGVAGDAGLPGAAFAAASASASSAASAAAAASAFAGTMPDSVDDGDGDMPPEDDDRCCAGVEPDGVRVAGAGTPATVERSPAAPVGIGGGVDFEPGRAGGGTAGSAADVIGAATVAVVVTGAGTVAAEVTGAGTGVVEITGAGTGVVDVVGAGGAIAFIVLLLLLAVVPSMLGAVHGADTATGPDGSSFDSLIGADADGGGPATNVRQRSQPHALFVATQRNNVPQTPHGGPFTIAVAITYRRRRGRERLDRHAGALPQR